MAQTHMVDVGVGAEVVGKVSRLWGLAIKCGGAIDLSRAIDFYHSGCWLLTGALLTPFLPCGYTQEITRLCCGCVSHSLQDPMQMQLSTCHLWRLIR